MDTIALRAFAVALLFSLPPAALAQAQTPPGSACFRAIATTPHGCAARCACCSDRALSRCTPLGNLDGLDLPARNRRS